LDPYSVEATREIQTGLFGRPLDPGNALDPPVDYRSFAYPAFTDLLFWPVAKVAFSALRVVLGFLLPLVIIGSLWIWLRVLQWRIAPLWLAVIAVLGVCNYPMLEAIFAEQPGIFAGAFLAGAALAIRRERLLLAGLLASLTFIKPQMSLLAIFYLLLWSFSDWRRRGQFVIGFFGMTFLLVIASLLIWPHWIASWLHVVFGYHRYATPPLVNYLIEPVLAARVGWLIIGGMIVLGLAFAWKNRRIDAASPHFWLTLSLLLAITSVTLLPGQAVYDHIILFPGIILLLQHWKDMTSSSRGLRIVSIMGTIVFFWPWVAAVGLTLVHPWLSAEHFFSPAVFALPIRTAASFPFVVLILLALATRLRVSTSEVS
jgi:hypothetical protein